MAELIISIFGLVLGIVSIGWHIINAHRQFLHIDLNITMNAGGYISAFTRVENKSRLNKTIENALLLIGPEDESPIKTANLVLNQSGFDIVVGSTNDIAAIDIAESAMGPEGREIIPLPFYFSENVGIADEKIAYKASIESDDIPDDLPYSVRFFVLLSPSRFFFIPGRHLHRSTHDSFILSR